MSPAPARSASEGATLRRFCPVLRALTTGPTVRAVEIELGRHMSRTEARRLIQAAKAAASHARPSGGTRLTRESNRFMFPPRSPEA